MSVIRMLVLGAVRIFAPTHGCSVRREPASWRVAEWAHRNPGSIYDAPRTLTREGFLAAEEQPGEPVARTAYRLTTDGQTEFLRLVRLVRPGLRELHAYEPGWLLAAVSSWGAPGRDEVLGALESRDQLLRARLSGNRFAAGSMPEAAAGTPDHVVELFTTTTSTTHHASAGGIR